MRFGLVLFLVAACNGNPPPVFSPPGDAAQSGDAGDGEACADLGSEIIVNYTEMVCAELIDCSNPGSVTGLRSVCLNLAGKPYRCTWPRRLDCDADPIQE